MANEGDQALSMYSRVQLWGQVFIAIQRLYLGIRVNNQGPRKDDFEEP